MKSVTIIYQLVFIQQMNHVTINTYISVDVNRLNWFLTTLMMHWLFTQAANDLQNSERQA